jgi:hypothetical protein
MNKGTIKRQFDKSIQGTNPPHLPRILTDDAIAWNKNSSQHL